MFFILYSTHRVYNIPDYKYMVFNTIKSISNYKNTIPKVYFTEQIQT